MTFSVKDRRLRVAVGVGHANSSGGNEYELRKNREVMKAFLALVEQSDGFDVRCYTPNNGQASFPGTLDAVVYATVHQWVKEGWIPDVVFEIHHEGLKNTAVRGGFVIHPDSFGLNGRKAGGGDFIDNDVKAAATGMARLICGEIGVPLRYGTGRMSERETGVATGPGKWRLGYFGALSDPVFQNNACVFISEAATYTSPADKAVMDSPGFADREALGLLKAVAYLAESRGSWTYPHKIGGVASKPTLPPDNEKESSMDYPTGMDEGIAAMLFGSANGYSFAPIGIVSTAWLERGKKIGTFPRLVEVREFDSRRYFVFSDGWTLMYNTAGGTLTALAA